MIALLGIFPLLIPSSAWHSSFGGSNPDNLRPKMVKAGKLRSTNRDEGRKGWFWLWANYTLFTITPSEEPYPSIFVLQCKSSMFKSSSMYQKVVGTLNSYARFWLFYFLQVNSICKSLTNELISAHKKYYSFVWYIINIFVLQIIYRTS